MCLYTCFSAEVAALLRCLVGSALPGLGVLTDGAVCPAQVKVATTTSLGQGFLVALDTGTTLGKLKSEFLSPYKNVKNFI